jgi:sterol desaturase/sphingolipid hydroxylase (fatty acid hydroxylase superfamily)
MLTYWEKIGWFEIFISPFLGALKLILIPTSRTYWPFLLVSLIVAFAVWFREKRSGQGLPNHLNVFSRETWRSRSALNDYYLITLNMVLFGLMLNAFIAHGPRWTELAARWLPVTGLVPASAISQTALSVLLAAALFLMDDFLRYFVHRLEHRIPWLWELHKVHHSATVLNFVTAERNHPISIFLTTNVLVVGGVLVNLLFLTLFAEKVQASYWLGANIFWVAGNFLASPLRHSPAWVSFGMRVERWLISPAQHQIHHSENPEHFDKNYGSVLAIWDRCSGSLYVTTPQRQLLTFGLGSETAQFETLRQLFVTPAKRIIGQKTF